jgi:hypothetical protein
LIKSRKESLVHFVNVSRRRRQTIRILWRGFEESHQPSDQPEEKGGYDCIQSSSCRGRESLDHHPVNHQPSSSTGVTQDLSPCEQRETPEKTSGIWSSGFIQVKWLEFAFGRSTRFNLNRPSFGMRVGRSDEVRVRRIGGPEDMILLQLGIVNSDSPTRGERHVGPN